MNFPSSPTTELLTRIDPIPRQWSLDGHDGGTDDPLFVSVIFPAYNEGHRLRDTLACVVEYMTRRQRPAEIIVADDGSTDRTETVVRTAMTAATSAAVCIRYLQLPHRGKGSAVRAGVLAARGDPIMFLDADLSIPVEILGTLMDALRDGVDIAVASRYVGGARVRRPLLRRLMSHAFRAIVHLILVTRTRDTQCGAKAYRAPAAARLFSRQTVNGYAFDAEILHIADRLQLRITEVPCVLVQLRTSSTSLLRDVPRMIRDLLVIRWRSISGRYD